MVTYGDCDIQPNELHVIKCEIINLKLNKEKKGENGKKNDKNIWKQEHKNEKKEETNTRKIKKIEDIRIKKENDFMKME